MTDLATLRQRDGPMVKPVSAKGRNWQWLLLVAATTAAGYSRSALGPLQETMRRALELNDNQIAALQGPALALPVVLAAVPLGMLIDRHSRARLLLIFALSELAGSILTAAASSFVLLFAARCLVGLATSAATVAAYSLLADLYAPAERGRAKSLLVVGQYGGASAVFALGGGALAVLGGAEGAWRWAMAAVAAPLILAVIAMTGLREQPRSGPTVAAPSIRATLRALREVGGQLAPLMLGIVLVELPVFGVTVWGAPSLARQFALAPARVGAIMAAALVVSGLAGPVGGGALADICQRVGGPRRTMLILAILALLAGPAGLFALTPNLGSAVTLLILFVTLMSAMIAIAVTLFTIVIPNDLRGLWLSVLTACVSIFGVALAPMIVSMTSTRLGGPQRIGEALGGVSVVACLGAATAFLIGAVRFEPREVRS